MHGGPQDVIAIVQRGKHLKAHRFGIADLHKGRRPRAEDHMRMANVAKAFSGATALSLVRKGVLSLGDSPHQRTSTALSAATLAAGSSAQRCAPSSVRSSRGEVPSRRGRGRTRQALRSSATGHVVGAHGKHPRLHPLCCGESRRAPLGNGVSQRATHPDGGQAVFEAHTACGGVHRVRLAHAYRLDPSQRDGRCTSNP